MRHVPGQHRAQVVGLSKSSAREEQCDGPRVNQQSYGGPITIRRALISHNAPFFFLPRADRDRTGCTWPRKVVRASIDFHDFSISFSMASKGRGLSLRSAATPPVWQKFDTDARRDEAVEILDDGDQPFIKCAGSAPCVTLFAPSAVSFGE